jgi:hypothetical protein
VHNRISDTLPLKILVLKSESWFESVSLWAVENFNVVDQKLTRSLYATCFQIVWDKDLATPWVSIVSYDSYVSCE